MSINDLTPMSVVPYSPDFLIDFIRHKTGWDQRNEVSTKTQLSYLCKYLEVEHIGCKTIVVESEYIDRHYLEDYSEYYARCFPSHPRKCARLHFFSFEMKEHDFISKLTNFDSKFKEELEKNYLGFAVIRPIPHTFFAKVCLKPYENLVSKPGYKVIQKANTVSLFGIPLSINTMPFLEQDKVVAACATSALWTALSASPQISHLNLPSPSAITKSAAHPHFEATRTFPATGLTTHQVARSLKYFGLEPSVIEISNDEPQKLKEIVYSYVTDSIPVLIGGDVYESNGKGEYSYLGKHLICVVGYHVKNSTDKSVFKLVSHDIDKLYVHDDRYGPFIKVSMTPKTFKYMGESKDGLSLSIHDEDEDLFVPDVAIVGSLSDFLCARGHEMIPKGKHHDRSNEYDQEDQETEGATAILG